MYLQALEMENFKSFKGRVRIPYDRGFTATTGPNGSGKSNCGDAIQFVLGTRSSKALRAQNVKDLIFNGGDGHKAATSCEVTLEFANPAGPDGRRRLGIDADLLRFTRRIRLRGKGGPDSTYELDGRSSSQAEFRRLLESAGMRSDGYNIVLQGDVTNLATMGSTPRRRVLDEIAGVTAYDEELRKAERQRVAVAEYLERIALLEEELSGRLAVLEKERTQALKLRELREALDNARRTRLFAEHRGRVEEVHLFEEEWSEHESEMVRQRTRALELEAEALSLDERLTSIQRELDELLGTDHQQLNDQERRLQVAIDRAADRLADAAREDADDEAAIEAAETAGATARAALDAHLGALGGAREVLDQAAADLNAAEDLEQAARSSLEVGDARLRDLNRAWAKATEAEEEASLAAAAATLEHDRATQAHEAASQRLGEAERVRDEHRLRRDDLAMEGEEIEREAPEQDRSALAAEWKTLEGSERKLLEESQELERTVRETSRALDLARGRLERESGARSGVASAVKGLLELRDHGRITGIHGTIAELVSPKDAEHEAALATAAGGGLHSIVVADDGVAQQCIEWLKRMKAGRATFLPLNKLATHRPGGRAVMVARQPGVIGFAADLLDVDPRYEAAVRYVVRDTLLVDSLGTARRHMGGVRMVTLGGDVVEAGGAMVGGSAGRSRGSFSGRMPGMDAVERLQGELSSLELRSQTVDSALRELRGRQQDLRTRIARIGTDQHSERRRIWEADVAEVEGRLRRAQVEVDELATAVREVERAMATAEALSLKARGAHDLTREERQSAADAVRAATPEHLADELRAAERMHIAAERAALGAKAALDGGQERTSLHEQQVERQRVEVERLTARRMARAETNASLLEQQELDRASLLTVQTALAEVSKEGKALQDTRLELAETRADVRNQAQQVGQRLDALARRVHDLTEQTAQRRQHLASLVQELAELDLTPPPEDVALPTVDEAERSVRRFEQRVEALGDVNMLSLEQYEETDRRLTQLSADRAELATHRQGLIDLAERLKEERRARLLGVLAEVNEHFQVVYAQLTDGGKAELRLEKLDDPFAGGLEMWAQPSGKSSQTRLEALSGGEKSMVALALIFSIQRFDPSPFYYLDEVDQNLDSDNAERIARLCREISQHSQFIMVTLRKVSLQLADHHIGVTHAGDGCSRLIAGFDRDRAVELGEHAWAETQQQLEGVRERVKRLAGLPTAEHMPRVPEHPGTPESLAELPHGALGEAHAEDFGDDSLRGLAGRTAGVSEDLDADAEARAAHAAALAAAEAAPPLAIPTLDAEEA